MRSFGLITAPVPDCGQFVLRSVNDVIIERVGKIDNIILCCKLGANKLSLMKLHVNQR